MLFLFAVGTKNPNMNKKILIFKEILMFWKKISIIENNTYIVHI